MLLFRCPRTLGNSGMLAAATEMGKGQFVPDLCVAFFIRVAAVTTGVAAAQGAPISISSKVLFSPHSNVEHAHLEASRQDREQIFVLSRWRTYPRAVVLVSAAVAAVAMVYLVLQCSIVGLSDASRTKIGRRLASSTQCKVGN